VFEAGLEALQAVFQYERLVFMLLGAGIGICLGVLPGLGGTVGMSILVPFVFGMDPTTGIGMLVGMAAVVHTSDTFPAVLLGVPGSGGAQATIMDGYPLARQGRAGEALGAAFVSSLVGGIIGAVALFLLILVARPLVLAMGAPELFMMSLLGLSMVGILARSSPVAGLLGGMLGLLLGGVGAATNAPAFRFTFDQLYLYDGLPIATVALGLFAVPEIVDLLAERSSIARSSTLSSGRMEGVRQAFRHRWLVVRSALVGILGLLPGIGGSVLDWTAYGVARQTSRNSETFGSGDIRGVIAPEAANNAKDGASLIPTLLFGIPGSGGMAILLGGLILLGLQPGPSMVGEDLPVTLSVVWTLVLANIVATLLCFGFTPWVARVSTVPAAKLMPFLIVLILVASYQGSRHWGDILALLGLGTLGWIMKALAWPRAPLLIGFVLADPVERYLWLSQGAYGWSWITRPTVIAIALCIVGLIAFGARKEKEYVVAPVAAPATGSTSTSESDQPRS
jgi:putative tricarboxylic transport membrane protein